MSLGLMMGINGALFVQPVAKYADPAVSRRVLERMAGGHAMGGLMITEPDFGTDALSMQTSWRHDGNSYTIKGTKHWAGLTGWADYWLVMARPKNDDGGLSQGVDMFICEQDHAEQRIEVIECYPNLGLYGLPYGKNRVDVRVPLDHRLDAGRSIVDARPFQIFEGSNDVLYSQIGTEILDGMRKRKTDDLGETLRADYAAGADIAKLGSVLDINVGERLSQRRVVDVG